MQLALYRSRANAERGWNTLTAGYPELGDVAKPLYLVIGEWIALRAVAPDVATRDRLCRTLRKQGAECIPATPGQSSGQEAETEFDRKGGETTAYGLSPLGNDSILISIADRRLLYQSAEGTVYVWPVAVGRYPSYHVFGETEVTAKRANPSWYPTSAMRRGNPRLPRRVGPGPHNPLGAYALNLGFQNIRIHGTNQPWSVGRAASLGCYRMHASSIELLYKAVSVGTKVKVSPKPLRQIASAHQVSQVRQVSQAD
jgi:lipoprotein-anchoring transpeptidase ErfK/SrfK